MNSRARYPPPGMGGERGVEMHSNAGLNHSFQPRNSVQQYVQRCPAPNNNQSNQLFQNTQPQQWLQRTKLTPADATIDEVEETMQSEAVDSSSQDWKASLKLPPQHSRFKTEVLEPLHKYKVRKQTLKPATDHPKSNQS